MGYTVHRIVIEEKGNLTITPHDKNIYVFKDFDITGAKGVVVGEIDVPEELVQQAEAYYEAQETLCSRLPEIEGLVRSFKSD
jgi:hypothetical protein